MNNLEARIRRLEDIFLGDNLSDLPDEYLFHLAENAIAEVKEHAPAELRRRLDDAFDMFTQAEIILASGILG